MIFKHMKKGFRFFARLVQLTGVLLLIYCAFVIVRGQMFQAEARRDFVRSLQQAQAAAGLPIPPARPLSTPLPAPPPVNGAQPNVSNVPQSRQAPLAGSVVGWLKIPRIQLSAIVVEGDDAHALELGAGHVPGTAEPWDSGNVVIAAHRDSFFRPLRKIAKDDQILLTTRDGSYQYVVDSIRITSPDDVAVLRDHGAPELTLITCYPFYYIGAAPDRFIVHAQRLPVSVAMKTP